MNYQLAIKHAGAFIILFLKRGHEKWRVSLENYAPIQPHEFNDFVIWLCRAEPGKQTILSPITTHAGAAGSLFSCANPQRANDYIFFLDIKNIHGKNECAGFASLFAVISIFIFSRWAAQQCWTW
jgi:hypothetical protein